MTKPTEPAETIEYLCLPPSRVWSVALGRQAWQPAEAEHLQNCPRCREVLTRAQGAILETKGKLERTRERLPALTRNQSRDLRTIPLHVVDRPVRVAAQPASQAAEVIRLINSQEGYDVLIYPAATQGDSTVQFVGVVPQEPFSLHLPDRHIEFVRPMDPHGFATVRTEALRPIEAGEAELSIRLE